MADHMSDEPMQNVLSRSGRKVYMGDLERRRPTKRMTTVRSFAIVRNWVVQQNEQLNEGDPSNVQNPQDSLRSDVAQPESMSTKLPHKPLGFQEVEPIPRKDDNVPFTSDDKEEVDVPPFATSNNQKIYAEPLTETSHGGLAEINDVNSMEVGNSPVRDELPAHNSAENSLPGGKRQDNRNEDDEDDGDDNNLSIFQKTTTVRSPSPQQNIRLKSGAHNEQRPSVAKRRVFIDRNTKENKQPCFNEEEYEAQNFVRLFNADRGRKGGAKDVTDLDIVLTNIEEVALGIKSAAQVALNKKLVREAFIQIRQKFSDTIDIYKEKKYLQGATAKTHSKIKKMKQELLHIQNKRKETSAKLNKLKAQCNATQNLIKLNITHFFNIMVEDDRFHPDVSQGNKEAYDFLIEFERFQDNLRKSDTSQSKEEYYREESMQSLLCETSGYLSSESQLRKINDDLQLWLNKRS